MARTEGSAPAAPRWMSVRDGSGEGLELGIEVLRGLRRADGAEGYLLQLGEGLGAQRGGALAPVGGIQVHVAGLDVPGRRRPLKWSSTVALKPLTDGIRPSCFWYSLRPSSEVRKVKNFSAALSLSPEILLLMPKAGSMEPGAYGCHPSSA